MRQWCRALLALLVLWPEPINSAVALGTTAKIGFLSDPHVCQGAHWETGPAGGVNGNQDQWTFIIDWMCDQGAQAIAVTGDLTVSADPESYNEDCEPKFKEFFESAIDGRAVLWPTAGNHDTELSLGALLPGETARTDNPHWPLTEQFPNLFRGKAYYYQDLGPVRYHSLANCADTTVWSASVWSQAYANCNPPYYGSAYWRALGYADGNQAFDNGDWAGIGNAASPQRVWFAKSLADDRPAWDIVGMHRGMWSPFNEPGRTSLYNGRYNLMAELSDAGADIVFQGDQHIVAWMRRLRSYPGGAEATEVSPADSLGPYVVSLHGTYVRRPVDTSKVPAGSLIFSKGGADSAGGNWVYGMYGEFTQNRARLQMVRTAQGPGPSYPLRIVKVAERVIYAKGARQ